MIYKQAVPFQLSSKAVILIDPTIGLDCNSQWARIFCEGAFIFKSFYSPNPSTNSETANSKMHELFDYRTRAIITRGLYTFYPLFEVQKRFFKGLFS